MSDLPLADMGAMAASASQRTSSLGTMLESEHRLSDCALQLMPALHLDKAQSKCLPATPSSMVYVEKAHP